MSGKFGRVCLQTVKLFHMKMTKEAECLNCRQLLNQPANIARHKENKHYKCMDANMQQNASRDKKKKT